MSAAECYLDLADVKARTKASKASIYAWMMAGTFPRGRKRGRRTLWLESEVSAWIEAEAKTLPKMGESMGARQPETKKPLESAA